MMVMYITKNRYIKYASYIDIPPLKFFYQTIQKALVQYKNGKKIDKKDTPVVYGSTVVDFNPRQDAEIARIEMNQRGVLRDFIGIDWDFEVGDEAKLDHVLQGLKSFHEHFQTSVIIYPTFSYPDKPRIRTVMFTENMMDASEYAQAVSFIIDTLKENPRDDDNYSIIKNFNLPVI